MRRAALLLWLISAACATGLGEECDAEVPCAKGLECRVPPHDGGVAMPAGVCDYPLRQEAEVCSAGADCAAELTCSNHYAPGSRYGRCVPRRADGEACFVDRDCASGRCTGKTPDAVTGTCVARS